MRISDWSSDVCSSDLTPLIADAERVYAITEDRLQAVSIEDGSIAWEFDLQGAPFSAPTLAGGRIYIALRAGQLVALDAATGEEIGRASCRERVCQYV